MSARQIKMAVKSQQGLQAACRSRMYRLLASASLLPTPGFLRQVASGEFQDAVRQTAKALPYPLPLQEDLGSDRDYQGFQAEFLGLFEVGSEHGAPCSLYEGHYGGVRNAIMGEILAFYHYFGLRRASGEYRELPDHLALEMEFMHGLTFKEAEAIEAGKTPAPYWKAERDFLERHLLHLSSAVEQRLAAVEGSFFIHMVKTTKRFCEGDVGYVAARMAGA